MIIVVIYFGPVVFCARESRKWADVSYLQMLELQCYISESAKVTYPKHYKNEKGATQNSSLGK